MATTAQKLVIVESPAKAKTIEKFLGKGYHVEASQGHVRDLPKSQLGVDADHDFEMKYITIRGRGNILARIKKEAKNASRVYLATDPDREGEAISWHLAHTLNLDPTEALPHRVSRNHQEGSQGCAGAPAAHRHGARGRAAGTPRPGPAGGLQDQPASVGEGEKGPVCRPRAERRYAVGGGA